MDMMNAHNTTGVDRYVNTLINALKNIPTIQLYWVCFCNDNNLLLHQEMVMDGYVKYIVPLPQDYMNIIKTPFWMNKYNKHVYRIISHLFVDKEQIVIHLHTLNLINLALYINQYIDVKIITHLHCIPWKNLYNSDLSCFNKLYFNEKSKKIINYRDYLTNHSELQSYRDCDGIICVTRCAKEFLIKTMSIPASKIAVIPNGIEDYNQNYTPRKFEGNLTALYVGNGSKSKGLEFILQALVKVKRSGYTLPLKIAGNVTDKYKKELISNYPSIEFKFLGLLQFDELKHVYASCDIGLIGSLQEQASYVAIEMAMYALPIVTTAVDGLDEMFQDNVNALKVRSKFSKSKGLRVDVSHYSAKIITLLEDRLLCSTLSESSRKLYLEELNLKAMVDFTVNVYINGGFFATLGGDSLSKFQIESNHNRLLSI